MTSRASSAAPTSASASRAGEPTANETMSRVWRATMPIVSSMNEPRGSRGALNRERAGAATSRLRSVIGPRLFGRGRGLADGEVDDRLGRPTRDLALGEPRHHRAELAPDALDLVVLLLRAAAVQLGRALAGLRDPAPRPGAVLHLGEHVAHRLAHAPVDDPLARGVVAELGGVADGVAH